MKLVISLTALLDINLLVDLREFNLHLTTEIKVVLELLSVCLLLNGFAAIRFALAMFTFGVTEAHMYFSFVNNNSFRWWVYCFIAMKRIR